MKSWKAHDEKVRPYIGWHRFLSSSQTLLLVLSVWWLLQSRQLAGFEAALTARGASGFSLFLWFFGTLAFLSECLSFPFSLSHYLVDRHYGVSRQGLSSWYADHIKGLIVGAALGLIFLLFAWWSVTTLGHFWWIALAAFFVFFSVVLAQLAPVLLLPFFFEMKPLPQGTLRDSLIEMSRKFGVSVEEIYLLGLGAKTEKGNAAFMGLGPTKRIAIGDTIYSKYPAEQVLAVFAHELGHLVHKDIWKGLGLSAVSLFLSFGIAEVICQSTVLPRWFTWTEAPFGLFLYFIVVVLVGLPLGVIERIYSRWRERCADRFAAQELGVGMALSDALETLTYQNRSYFYPSVFREFWTYSHPAPWRRITSLRSAGSKAAS